MELISSSRMRAGMERGGMVVQGRAGEVALVLVGPAAGGLVLVAKEAGSQAVVVAVLLQVVTGSLGSSRRASSRVARGRGPLARVAVGSRAGSMQERGAQRALQASTMGSRARGLQLQVRAVARAGAQGLMAMAQAQAGQRMLKVP